MAGFTPGLLLPRLAALGQARSGWVAFSGGLDSTVLLHALVAIRGRLRFALRAIHVDHGLHSDSEAWARHCALICSQLEVPFETARVSVPPLRGESLEELARDRRYEAMASVLEPGDLLLTAQHRDDQAETLLLALMRGSGPKGLAAMPEIAPLGEGRLARPLLAYGREEIAAYAKSQGLSWLEDPANVDLRFARNFVRRRVLPTLKERWPAAAGSIARSAAHCAEAQGIVDSVSADLLPHAAGSKHGTLSVSCLAGLTPPLRKAVLRRWLDERGFEAPDARHLRRIVSEVLTARGDADPLVCWRGCEVRRYRADLYAMAPLPTPPSSEPAAWSGGVLALPQGLGSLRLCAADGLDVDPWSRFPDGLIVRFGVQGLRCRRLQTAHRRPLKKLFQEVGIPPWMRPYIPLIFYADELVAVGDLWLCQGSEKAYGQLGFSWRPERPLSIIKGLL